MDVSIDDERIDHDRFDVQLMLNNDESEDTKEGSLIENGISIFTF